MRAAEAIRLGSLVIKPVAGRVTDGNGGGCAIGMGNYSLTGHSGNDMYVFGGSPMAEKYPWLEQEQESFTSPCSCKGDILLGASLQPLSREYIESCPWRTMVHLFNHHVATVKDWTIDRLCEWLDSVDPTPREACDMGASPLCEHKTAPQTNELELTR